MVLEYDILEYFMSLQCNNTKYSDTLHLSGFLAVKMQIPVSFKHHLYI